MYLLAGFGRGRSFMEKKVQTDFLFAQPSIVSGAARILDLYGLFDDYNRSESALDADQKAIASDWFVVGQDLCDAIESQDEELRVA
jgi:hypothetical protein